MESYLILTDHIQGIKSVLLTEQKILYNQNLEPCQTWYFQVFNMFLRSEILSKFGIIFVSASLLLRP